MTTAMPQAEELERRNSETLSDKTAQDGVVAGTASAPPAMPPFSMQFLDKSPAAAAARVIYFKTLFGGVMGLSIVIFAVCSIYWGSVWSSPHHTLPGWIVVRPAPTLTYSGSIDFNCVPAMQDFDGGFVGQGVAQALSAIDPGELGIYWQVLPASQFPNGATQLEDAIVREDTWYGFTSAFSADL